MVDQKVLDAQKWVNSTYGSVKEYDKCPEDGKIGWSTMYSLLYGLQHELGITTLVASFGPTTKNKLTALGDITLGWTKNKNIIKIIQHALFAKAIGGLVLMNSGHLAPQLTLLSKKCRLIWGSLIQVKLPPIFFIVS